MLTVYTKLASIAQLAKFMQESMLFPAPHGAARKERIGTFSSVDLVDSSMGNQVRECLI